MIQLRLTDLAVTYGGTLLNPDCQFNRVSTDSRHTAEGDLFVALQGERFDAHQFLPDVATKAAGVVVSQRNQQIQLPQWVVEDTTRALGQIAAARRALHRGPLIAITGSSGKTSVKEMTAAIMGQNSAVHATAGNLNNHIGVPLTLLNMGANSDVAVIEMGASGAGEIAYLCEIAKPNIALINNVQRAHLEGFGSIEGIASGKGEIYSGLSADGTAILNLDQSWCAQWRQLIANRPCITFSIADREADLGAEQIETLDNGCCKFQLCDRRNGDTSRRQIALSVPGIHMVSNALAAAACATAAGADMDQIAVGLAAVLPVSGRLNSIELAPDLTLIDDTYNANPDSFRAGIDVLSTSAGYRILVMGDMAELGDQSQDLHRQIGEYALQAGIDRVFTAGTWSAVAADACNGTHYNNTELLIEALKEALDRARKEQGKTVVLVKGSRSSRMDQVITILNREGAL
jgi:UDP-N-acetylmuramoyl-tripeptide--D-alanyl-D-alanine ligase